MLPLINQVKLIWKSLIELSKVRQTNRLNLKDDSKVTEIAIPSQLSLASSLANEAWALTLLELYAEKQDKSPAELQPTTAAKITVSSTRSWECAVSATAVSASWKVRTWIWPFDLASDLFVALCNTGMSLSAGGLCLSAGFIALRQTVDMPSAVDREYKGSNRVL